MQETGRKVHTYTPPGPVVAAFHRDDNFVRGILGPVGSGKSSGCCWEIVKRAAHQAPDRSGKRRTRWAVTRSTYGELRTTTIKTWLEWFGSVGVIRWDPPITFRMQIGDLGDGTSLDMEVVFLALDKPEELGKLRSLELTGGWINEASEVPQEVLDMLTSRCDRFPSKKDGVGPTWTGVFFDSNYPDDDHWIYRLLEEKKTPGWSLYKQPGALTWVGDAKKGDRYDDPTKYVPNPDAENIQNLNSGFGYYQRQISGKSKKFIDVFIVAKWGSTLTGKPVYEEEWSDELHLAKEPLKAFDGYPLILSFDYGLTPAAILGQLGPQGRLLILREWACEEGQSMAIRQFYSEIVRPDIYKDWGRYRIYGTGDPAGRQRAQTDEKSCMQELAELGMAVEPAETNDFLPRRDSVAYFLRLMAGDNPGFVLDPSCKMLRKGFNGGYLYSRLNVSGSDIRHKDRPEKNKYSHPHDALQYLCMKARGDMNPVRARPIQQRSASGWT